MTTIQKKHIQNTLNELFEDSRYDYIRMAKGAAKSIFGPLRPIHFKDAYLSISREQGAGLVELIKRNNIKNIVEFGTSFGISTIFLAQGALETDGHIITTELIDSKARKAFKNFKKAGVNDIIEIRVGDAMQTLKNHHQPIDLLLLDGWKDLYLPLFRMLEQNFHHNTIIYVDNADMGDVQAFLRKINQNPKYQLESIYDGKVVLITVTE